MITTEPGHACHPGTHIELRRAKRRGRAAWLALALVVGVVTARGAQGAEPDRAETLFQRARELMGENDFATACPLLEEAYSLDRGAGTLLALALCHEGNRKPATALREYRESLSLAVQADRPDRVMLAESHVQRLEASVPRVVVRLASAPPAGLVLMLDGATLDRTTMIAGAPVDPGTHEVAASAPATVPWHGAVDVAAASGTTVVDVPALVSLVRAPVLAPAAARSSLARTLGWTAGGLGVIAAALGAVFGGSAFGAEARSKAECDGSQCTSDGVTWNQRARQDALVSDVSFGVGGAALATSLWLLLRASHHTGSALRAPTVGAWARAGQAGVGLSTSW
jgi:hypothetical protein